MSLLKAIGKGLVSLARFLGHQPGAFQMVAGVLPGGALASVFATIAQVEVVGAQTNLTGEQKYAAAWYMLAMQMAEWCPGEVQDRAMYERGISGITQGAVDVMNSLKAPVAPPS